MPILERDPWRFQYFEKIKCPEHVVIPTDDLDCWELHPTHRWVYDKLRIAKSQGIAAAPHGFMPENYPVFSKPNVNLKGMGIGSLAIHSDGEMRKSYKQGHMWMMLLTGEHVSSDCAVVDGALQWIRHATGFTSTGGMFDYWKIHAAENLTLEDFLSKWISKHMAGYTGMMNFETIGGQIIEAHLRFADQWPDLYGAGWVEALIKLYADKIWRFKDTRRDGYSVPLFAKHGFEFEHPSVDQQETIRKLKSVTSLQITFHDSKEATAHPMPPGGFRLAIVNCTDLESGMAAREILRQSFPSEKMFSVL